MSILKSEKSIVEYSTTPPSVSHLNDRFNNQELFDSWWNWRLCRTYLGGSRHNYPQQSSIPFETIVQKTERLRIWNEIAQKEDDRAKKLYNIQKSQEKHQVQNQAQIEVQNH